MKAEQLKVGNKVQLDNGATALVVRVPRSGAEVRVRFLDSPFETELEGKEGNVSVDTITGHYEGDDLTKTSGALA